MHRQTAVTERTLPSKYGSSALAFEPHDVILGGRLREVTWEVAHADLRNSDMPKECTEL